MYVAEPPERAALMESIPNDRLVHALVTLKRTSDYPHWDKLRHLEPPGDLTHDEWWLATKIRRSDLLRQLPLRDASGRPLGYAMPDEVLRLLHYVDQRCSGEVAMEEVVTADEQARQHYLVNSLMEEAIRSSQLEGATTSRRVAKELLRSGRPPKDRSERMILNNYRALQFMRERDELTPGTVLELQRILTEGTLEDSADGGRLQRPEDDRVGVYDLGDGSLIYAPPPAEQLPARLELLCRFANGTGDDQEFLHPVVRAILIHFWVGYEHPFEDGNGRTARALFYWSMRRQGYWLTDYLSISHILRKSPTKYSRAYVLTETDEGDATYFLIYQLEVIQRAIDEFYSYLRRKIREVQEVEQLVKGSAMFNHRQLALLSNAARNSGRTYTFRSHAASHGVTHETARTDLLHLWKRKLLVRRKLGRQYVFTAAPNLGETLKQVA
jgi:Fic family protein